jgi:trk system potassium uptake protein TrkH
MDAEAPGPGIEKLTPRIAETARVLWLVYLGFTVVQFLLLYGLHLVGLAPNMTLYNAVAHPLTTMPTGGFSPEARSIEAFSAVVQWVIIPFMVAAGTNFALFWHVVRGESSNLFGDSEFRLFTGIMGALAAIGAVVLFTGPALLGPTNPVEVIGDGESSLRHSVFNIVSIVTTTGYASMNFEVWSGPAKYLLLFAMFIGGSAGSTGGGIKIVRWLVIVKSIRRELFTTVHPEAVSPVRLAGRALDERALRGIYTFTLLYFVLFFAGALLIAVDASRVGLDLTVVEAVTASAATLGNIGPGLGMVGPMGSYLDFPPTSKLLMVALMWIGRLEILPVLVLLTSGYWQS